MVQITQGERIKRINQLLADQQKVPPEQHEVMRLSWTGGDPLHCHVIKMHVDEVLLNHKSHRIRAQLQDDPEWGNVEADPFSAEAQALIARRVRDSRSAERFAALKESLLSEGQTEPGVMTHTGLLINANNRAVAIREFDDPTLRYIRVAVLPETAQQQELALLELRLQMQKDLKEEYSLTNELLFIEELSVERKVPDAYIAHELRIFPDNPKKGEKEVQFRLQALDLIRTMQRIPDEPLKLTFFDAISYEHLRDLHRDYHRLLDTDPAAARRHLESFLLSIAAGVTAVHRTRKIDADFMATYMLPQLEEHEIVGQVADQLVAPKAGGGKPAGVSALRPQEDDDEDPQVDLGGLIGLITRRDKRIDIPGSKIVLGKDDVRDALNEAILGGIKTKARDVKDADKLAAPASAVQDATRDLKKATEALAVVRGDPDFDDRRRTKLEMEFKKLCRTQHSLEQALQKAGIVSARR